MKKLKRLHLVKNEFDSVESCQAVADAIAKCPRFEECLTQKSGVKITVNHRVKVRRTQIFVTEDPDTKKEKREEHVVNAEPIYVKDRDPSIFKQ